VAIELLAAEGRRDGSGVPAAAVIAHVATAPSTGPQAGAVADRDAGAGEAE
jgi:DNA gyrase subunit A